MNAEQPADQKAANGAPLAARKPRQRKSRSAPATALIPMHEVNAILCIGGGLLMHRFEPQAPVDGGVAESKTMVGWETSIPYEVSNRLRSAVDFGDVLAFEVSVRPGDRVLPNGRVEFRSPISISRAKRLISRNLETRDLIRARVHDFPDVALDSIPFDAEPTAFLDVPSELKLGPTPARQPQSRPSDPTDDVGRARERSLDKCAGAIASVLNALTVRTWEPSSLELISKFLTGIGGSGADSAALVSRLAALLEGTALSDVGPTFIRSMALRLEPLSTREGFDPEELLRCACEDSRAILSGSLRTQLERFEEKARGVLAFTEDFAPDRLLDGGSIGLRASLAFLQAGSSARLEAMMARGATVGPRVGLTARALAGVFHGCTGLPREQKARPVGVLNLVGDTVEELARGEKPAVALRKLSGGDVGGDWLVARGDTTVFKVGISLPQALVDVLKHARSAKWTVRSDDDGMTCLIDHALGELTVQARLVATSPFVPAQPLLRLRAVCEGLKPRAIPSPKSLQRLFGAAAQSSLEAMVDLTPGKRATYLTIYMAPASISSAELAGAVDRMAAARVSALKEDATESQP